MTSPGLSFGSSLLLTHSTNRSLFAVANIVLKTTQPERRMAPIKVRFLPQFMGVRSTYSSPFFTHAWERVIERLSPDSSRNTSFSTGTRRMSRVNASRFAATSGRSCSNGRTRFFSLRNLLYREPA